MTFAEYCIIFLESVGDWRVIFWLICIAIFALFRKWYLVLLVLFVLSNLLGIIFASKLLTEYKGYLILSLALFLPVFSIIICPVVAHHLFTEKEKASKLEKTSREMKELQEMLIQAEKASPLVQIVGGIAHEIKNPLGTILQGVNYLEKKLPHQQKDVFEVLSMIKNNINRADNVIISLLDFSRHTDLVLQPEDINSILESSLGLVKQRLKSRGDIQIIKETKKDIPKVLVDKNKIEQVFINILLNAIQAIPQEGKIFIRSYDKQLEIVKDDGPIGRRKGDFFSPGERTVIVEIEDTGMGISEENLKKIFHPFFTTKRKDGGSGLGLSVSQSIVSMHRGLIDIKSQVGKGTKVMVTLKITGG